MSSAFAVLFFAAELRICQLAEVRLAVSLATLARAEAATEEAEQRVDEARGQ